MESRDDGREALPSTKPEPTVAASANKCLASFDEALKRASIRSERDLSMVEDYCARFSTWAATMGVFESARASMDHRLRVAPDVRDVVNGLLESLSYRILKCSTIFDELLQNVTPTEIHPKKVQLEQAFSEIGTEISHLNKISNTIRRASKEMHIQRARKFLITDDEGTDIEATLSNQFVRMIRDRFHLIREDVELRGDTKLEQRLVRSMILRWKRVLHRRHREGFDAIEIRQTGSKTSMNVPMLYAKRFDRKANDGKAVQAKAFAASTPSPASPSIVRSAATTLDPTNHRRVSSSPSVISNSKTIGWGRSLVFPEAPGSLKRREHEERMSAIKVDIDTKLGGSDMSSERIIKLEESKNASLKAAGEITCPYCLYALPAENVFIKEKWERHVQKDLHPYVCLFKECGQEDILFSNGDEWLRHMNQHAKCWRCSSGHELCQFLSRTEYMQHMRETHVVTLTDDRLRTLANVSARNRKPLFSACPLCGDNKPETLETLETHIAEHLRFLALRSLPMYSETSPDDIGSNNNTNDSFFESQSHTGNCSSSEDNAPLEFIDDNPESPQIATEDTQNMPEYMKHLPDYPESQIKAWIHVCEEIAASSQNVQGMEDDVVLQSLSQGRPDKPLPFMSVWGSRTEKVWPSLPLQIPGVPTEDVDKRLSQIVNILAHHMKRNYSVQRPRQPISLRRCMVGKTPETAVPGIVVLCHRNDISPLSKLLDTKLLSSLGISPLSKSLGTMLLSSLNIRKSRHHTSEDPAFLAEPRFTLYYAIANLQHV